jgi:hypothetical protein
MLYVFCTTLKNVTKINNFEKCNMQTFYMNLYNVCTFTYFFDVDTSLAGLQAHFLVNASLQMLDRNFGIARNRLFHG